MGGGGHTTTTTKADPWDKQKPYLQSGFQSAQDLYKSGQLAPDYYPGSTVAPQSQATQDAIQLQINRARAGSPLIKASQNQLSQTMNGNYLNSNPVNGYLSGIASGNGSDMGASAFQGLANQSGQQNLSSIAGQGSSNSYLDSMYSQAAGQVRSNLDSQFESGGRYGSGAHEAAMGSALNNLATNMYGSAYDSDANRRLSASQSLAQNQLGAASGLSQAEQAQQAGQISAASQISDAYNKERTNQIRGMLFAPSLSQADYQDIAALSEAGQAQDTYAQNLLNDQINRYNYTSQQPLTGLQNYMNLIQGNYGGTSSAKTASGSRVTGALGGSALGAGIGFLTGDSLGAGIGAGAGGLLGLFS